MWSCNVGVGSQMTSSAKYLSVGGEGGRNLDECVPLPPLAASSFIKDWDVIAAACPLPEINDIICLVGRIFGYVYASLHQKRVQMRICARIG
jgi:hypothetical protein